MEAGLSLTRAITAAMALGLCVWLWLVKRAAYERVKSDGVNGAVAALARERLRHRLFMVALSTALLVSALVSTQWRMTIMTVVNVGMGVDAVLAFRARQLVNVLVQEYHARHGGGRRATDPK